jgi:hypothetical protein
VVLDVDREATLGRVEARPLRHRPALQRSVELKPEIAVQPPRRVLLDDVAEGIGVSFAARTSRAGLLARRFGGAREEEAIALQRPLPPAELRMVATGRRADEEGAAFAA